MNKVYIASKLSYAAEVYQLRFDYPHIHFTQRWDLMESKIPDTSEFARHFWLDDECDVLRSNTVIVYCKEGDKLRGALVEAGMAIAAGINVFVIGNHPDYGTWQYHPRVERYLTMKDALFAVKYAAG